MRHLVLYWSPAAPERKHPRHTVKSRVSIVHGFEGVVGALNGAGAAPECDKQVSTIENPASYTCTATQNFTTTSTAYAPSDITFTLNDTPTADKEVEIYIECTATSGLTNNVIVGGFYIEWN